MRTTSVLALVVAVAATSACSAQAQVEYGASTAGPSTGSEPRPVPGAQPAVGTRTPEPAPTREPPPKRTVSACEVYTSKEVSTVLGLPVAAGDRRDDGPFDTCAWHATVAPKVPFWREGDPVLAFDDGVVTVTLGDVRDYPELARKVQATMRAKKATVVQPMPKLGPSAFMVGTSVSGVPVWSAYAAQDDRAVAVEVSGADSLSGQGTITDFLQRTLRRIRAHGARS